VCPAIFKPQEPLSGYTYYNGWRRILERTGVPHIGTHGVRHRAATVIANSGVPVKIGIALTAHKTVQMFTRYVHAEDDPIEQPALCSTSDTGQHAALMAGLTKLSPNGDNS
jgi:integrase